MGKNKTGKYLKYAIGEIVLVVIGILIAIQLNEWRKESNNNNQKQVILMALKLEYESNLHQLDTVFYYEEKVAKAYSNAHEMIKNSLEGYTNNELEVAIRDHAWTWTFNPSNGVLRSAISSGEIHLLGNKRLIELLFSWEDVILDSEEEAQRMREHQYDSNTMLSKYIRFSEVWQDVYPNIVQTNHPSDYKSFLLSIEFEDYSLLSYAYNFEYLSELNSIKNQNKEILKLIDKELVKE